MRFYCEDTNRLFSRSSSAYFAMIPNKSTSWHIAFEFAKGSWRDLEVGLVWNKDQREVRKSIKLLTPLFDKGPNNIWFYGWKYVNHPSWDTAYLLEVANNPKEFEAEYEELINDILKFINLEELKSGTVWKIKAESEGYSEEIFSLLIDWFQDEIFVSASLSKN
jgi:hypothetical protein